jgi:hypothetical protein
MSEGDTTFSRALRRMSLPELRDLWAAIVDGRLDATLPPRERFAVWYRRQRDAEFAERFNRLSVKDMSDAWLRLIAGEDPDSILPPLPINTQPASEGAGPPDEGHDVNATHRARSDD